MAKMLRDAGRAGGRALLKINVLTMHQTFVETLNSAGIEGARAEYGPTMAYDTAGEYLREIVITAISAEALKLVMEWIIEYLRREPPRETRINNRPINNADNVVVIVNNYLDTQNERKDSEPR